MEKMKSHKQKADEQIVHEYEVDTLGAPFKVSIIDVASIRIDPKTGKKSVQIPDLVGLINSVVRRRVSDKRKLNGPELKFLRTAIRVRAKTLAEFLDMSPEHLSRCEAGSKVMTTVSEKLLRLSVYLATYMAEPQDMFEKQVDEDEIVKKAGEPEDILKRIVNRFLLMKIQSVFDPSVELKYSFRRVDTSEQWSTEAA